MKSKRRNLGTIYLLPATKIYNFGGIFLYLNEKGGIIRNESLVLWILSMCKVWRLTHKLSIKPFGLYVVCE